jgi:hypothetical protein
MTITRHHDTTPDTLDAAEVFRFLGYDPNDPAARAVVGLCLRYQLDPFAGHIIVIQGRRSPYVTRDGHLWLAHRSGQFDGMETLDEWVKEEKYCCAKVAVWRKDMSHPFVYTGRCPIKSDRGGWDYNADKKAVANAEVRALKRAFPLQLPSIVDYEDDLETSDPGKASAPPRPAGSDPTSGEGERGRPAASDAKPGQPHRRHDPSPDADASVTGQDPPGSPNAEAPTSPPPASPGDGDTNRSGRRRRDTGTGKLGPSAAPAGPQSDEADLLAYEKANAAEDPGRWTR